ncbi:monocarboxylate transporter 5-like [Argonauta hians]
MDTDTQDKDKDLTMAGKDNGQVIDTDRRPIDRDWAWVVLTAASLLMIISMGNSRSFGIFFFEILQLFNASSSALSTVLSVEHIASCVTGFVAMNCLAKFFSLRTFVLCGSSFCALTFVLDSVTKDIFLLPFIHIFNGSGRAFIYGSCIVVQSTYFSRYLGTANAISACGVSIGQFTLPFLLNYLIETFGVRGALLLNGGIYLQCLVFAALLRPMSYYDAKPPSKKVKQTDIELNERNVPTDIDTQQIESSKLLSDHGRDIYPSLSDRDNKTAMESNHSVVESSVREPLNSSGGDRQFHVKDKDNEVEFIEKSETMINDTSKGKTVSIFARCNENIRKLLSAPDFSLFRKKIFVVGFIATITASAGVSIPQTYFPAHSIDLGLTSSDGVFFLTVSGAADFAGRILVILLADRKFMNRARFLGIIHLVHGITACFVTYYTKFYLFAIYCAFYGLSSGVHFSISNTVMVDFIGAKRMSDAVGLVILGSGVLATAEFPFIGYLRDLTGSYNIVFVLNGVGLLISGAMYLLEPFISYKKQT